MIFRHNLLSKGGVLLTSKFSKNKKIIFYITVPILIYALFQQVKQQYLPKTYPIPIKQQDISRSTETDTETFSNDAEQTNVLNQLSDTTPTSVVIYVTGAVKNPGVVELNSNQRLKDAIAMVGGFTEDADMSSVNLAEFVKDEQHYIVAKIGETLPTQTTSSNANTKISNNNSSLININTATKEELKSLNGIGDGLSQRVIDFREQHGSFSSIESIKSVSGIGEKKFDAIKDYITVR